MLKNRSSSFGLVDSLLGLIGFFVMIGLCFFVVHKIDPSTSKSTAYNQTSTSASSSVASYAILSPATVPSKAPECKQTIALQADGNSGPVTCANGDLNVDEWDALATLEPTVLTLGYGASSAQVQAALCADVKSSQSDANTNNASVIEGTIYQIASLYYGWNFSTNPSSVLSQAGC